MTRKQLLMERIVILIILICAFWHGYLNVYYFSHKCTKSAVYNDKQIELTLLKNDL
jgi:hypothetical protein